MRWRRTGKDVEELVALQQELLNAAAVLVKPGGVLVYSTCSIEEDEDQGAVQAFLSRHPEFEVEPAQAPQTKAGAQIGVPDAVLTPAGFMATLPHVHGTDGAFAARMRRKLGQ